MPSAAAPSAPADQRQLGLGLRPYALFSKARRFPAFRCCS
jgi:hypothetical protein